MTHDTPGGDDRSRAATPESVELVATQLRKERQPFARVTVVRREPPVSARVGDRALVTADGDIVGWIGGTACAESVVREQAMTALQVGDPRLVGLAPDPGTIDRPGLESFPMQCHSGGVLELFVEPVVPTRRLVVVGDTAVARALARMATELSYDVTAVSTSGEAPDGLPDGVAVGSAHDRAALSEIVEGASFLVVATMGDGDEAGLETGLRAAVPYVALVASSDRADVLFERVAERVDRPLSAVETAVTCPAGLDVGAETPGEIAVSILAEVVASGASADVPATSSDPSDAARAGDDTTSAAGTGDATRGTEDDDALVTDPVCGMDVVVGEAAATVQIDGERYNFCSEGCADAFEEEPGRYLGHGAEAG